LSDSDQALICVADPDLPELLGASLLDRSGDDLDPTADHRAQEVGVVVDTHGDKTVLGGGRHGTDSGCALDGGRVDTAVDEPPRLVVLRAEVDDAFDQAGGDVGEPQAGGDQKIAGVLQIRVCGLSVSVTRSPPGPGTMPSG